MLQTNEFVVPGVPAPFRFSLCRNGEGFPVGQVGNPATPGKQAYETIIAKYGDRYAVQNMALAPHDRTAPNGVGHNVVKPIHKIKGHASHICDALVVFDFSRPWLLDTSVADCPVTVFVDIKGRAAGFMHSGWPEMCMEQPNIVDKFFEVWPAPPEDTVAFISPAIAGQRFERDPTTIPQEYQLLCGVKSVWGTTGFDLLCAVIQDLRKHKVPVGHIFPTKDSDGKPIDTYSATESGKYNWISSDQLAKRQRTPENPNVFADRMVAMLTYGDVDFTEGKGE